jgi:phytoene synthase
MTTLATNSPEAALRYCRDLTRRRARNFYYGLKLLPEPQRSALYTIYAWMRRADDLADDARDGADAARARIDALRRDTMGALAGAPAGRDAVLVGLREVAARFPLDPAHFNAMLEGQLEDLEGRRYETFEALREYCYRVAATVGLICINVWGYDDPRAPRLAVERGIAFQLTNIVRDFVEDYDAGRVYLPAEDFARHGIAPDDLRRFAPAETCRRFLLEQIERAEAHYRRSEALDGMIAPACRPTLWAMTTIYHRLLARMRRDPEQVVRGPRVRLTALNKGTIAIQARFRARGARREATAPEAGAAGGRLGGTGTSRG